MKGEKGFALVITLIVAALLVALTVEFVNEVYVDTSARQNFVDGQQASLLAGSGIAGEIKILQLTVQAQSYNSLLDQWAKPLEIDDETGHLRVIIEDESSKLNLNAIFGSNGSVANQPNHDIAVGLFKKLGLSIDLLDALADWVDQNETVQPGPGGAESAYYNTLKPPYGSKNAPLNTIDELALVKGFDSKTMARLRPYITVYSDASGLININTAPKEIIAALTGMNEDLAAQVLDYRKTTPFKLNTDLNKVSGLSSAIAMGLVTSTTVKGTAFRIVSQATVKETIRIVEAVVSINGPTPTVLYWREY